MLTTEGILDLDANDLTAEFAETTNYNINGSQNRPLVTLPRICGTQGSLYCAKSSYWLPGQPMVVHTKNLMSHTTGGTSPHQCT